MPTIGLLTPSGWGNLGDAAIQDVTIEAIRARWPAARIVGFTSNATDTEARHGIPAFPLSGYAPANYSVGRRVEGRGMALLARLSAAAQARSVPPWLIRPPVAVWQFLSGETAHWPLAREWMRRLDLLLVSGGGQVDDFWGGSWGHPYTLWKWGFLARRSATPVAYLSVGLGSLRSPLARYFARRGLRTAQYRSYRDARSRTGIQQLMGADAGLVVPDLAFGFSPSGPRSASGGATVGVSPIAFADPRVWPDKDGTVYRAYVARMAAVVRELTGAGRDVVLFSTDQPDRLVMDDVWQAAGQPRRARLALTDTVSRLFSVLADVGVVIASRLHGVILAHLAAKPVVAVSYNWKVAQHMQDLDQSSYTLDIGSFTPASLGDTLADIEAHGDDVRVRVAAGVAAARARVLQQFADVLG